jgi:subfamily B ATP-binding cassette protein HlyB/CyaB
MIIKGGERASSGSEPSTVELGLDTGLEGLVMMLRFNGIATTSDQIRHRFCQSGQPIDALDMVRCAKSEGLRASFVTTTFARLQKTHFPVLAKLKTGQFVVLAGVGDGKALVQDPATGKLALEPAEQFLDRWSGQLLLVTKRLSLSDLGRPFGMSWFVTAVHKYRRILTEVLVASFFLQLLGLVSPLFFQVIVDKVLVHRGVTTLDVLIIGLVTVSVFEALLGCLRTYIFSHTTNRLDVELGARLFRKLISLPLNYFQSRRAGETVARMRELENIRQFITGSGLTLVVDLFFTFVFLAVMAWYSLVLTGIVMAAFPLYAGLILLIKPAFRAKLDDKFRRTAENQSFLVEAITGVETVKAMAIEPQMERRWEDQLAGYVGASFSAAHLGNWASQTVQLISKLSTGAVLWFGAHAVMRGDMTVGQLCAFNMLSQRVTQPVLRLAQMWQDFQQARVSIARVADIMNAPSELSGQQSRSALPPIKGHITFDRLVYRYRLDGQAVLNQIDLEIGAGQVVGIVGPSGSGKSTLTKLVQRLYVPESGRVLIDGIDLTMVDSAWLRRQIGVVLQENVLFNRTIRENIAIANPAMPIEPVLEAARLAGAHEFIAELPEAYDTMVGERGASLSGGQRQRIAIARALIGNPRILIFDEATSALDYESERAIQQNMRLICQGRTVLVIAHRLSTVRTADRIITIERGRVVEEGTHDELLRKGGRYAALHRVQAGEVLHEAV